MASSDPDSLDREFSIAHLNINSLRNKVHEIYYRLTCDKIHVMALCETKLDSSVYNSELNIRGYSLYRRDRDSCGGGVALYIHNQIPAELQPDLMPDEIEMIWVQIHLPDGKPVLVGCCYRPADATAEYLDKICETIKKVKKKKEENDIFLLGDFNIDWKTCSLQQHKLFSVSSECGFRQVMKDPTRVMIRKDGKKTSTCIDHIYTNVPELCAKPSSTATGCSDHNVVGVTVRRNVPKVQEEKITQRSYSQFGFIKDAQWDDIYNKSQPEAALSNFMRIFGRIAGGHAPLPCGKATTFAPWFEETKCFMSERDDAKTQVNNSDTWQCQEWNKYLKLKRKANKMNKDKKNKHFRLRLKKAKHDAKKVHQIFKDFLGQNSVSPVTSIYSKGGLITEPAGIAEHLHEYYINKAKKLRSGLSGYEGQSLSRSLIKQRIMKSKQYSFSFEEVNVERVRDVLSSLPEDLPAGLDNLDVTLLKAAAEHISAPVCHIVNRCLLSGVFPSMWKKSKIIPVPKNNNANFSVENSRAVSSLPVLSQILEKIMLHQIQQHFVRNQLFSQCQSYREVDSTSVLLDNMIKNWYTELDNSKLVGAVFLDLSASSDLISHDLLLDKLKLYGFSDSALRLMKSYLSNRKQKVCYNFSQWRTVDFGLPHGSYLGRFLFSNFTNDLRLVLKQSSVVMYEHHMTVYYSAQYPWEINCTLIGELKAVMNWVYDNKLILNISHPVTITNKDTLSDTCELLVSVVKAELDQINPIKLLAVRLNQHLSWSLHFDNILNKIVKGVTVRKGKAAVSPQVLKTVVEALVFSHLDNPSVL